jgi:hypothetical protein
MLSSSSSKKWFLRIVLLPMLDYAFKNFALIGDRGVIGIST